MPLYYLNTSFYVYFLLFLNYPQTDPSLREVCTIRVGESIEFVVGLGFHFRDFDFEIEEEACGDFDFD